MSQITSGTRKILSIPFVYKAFQAIIGTGNSKNKLVNEHIKIANKQSILDIGCGTGMLLDNLPSTVRYVGFDISEKYVAYAKKKYGERGLFVHRKIDEQLLDEFKDFDRVVAIGVLHHLNDEEARRLLTLAKKALKSGSGEFHSIDPCYVDKQSRISKFLVKRDRGQNVRTADRYESLAREVFSDVVIHNRNDMLRIPYDHAILCCN
jgi:cyclopropane fatty-acyl-phospholipid synthase-like methyltransferase